MIINSVCIINIIIIIIIIGLSASIKTNIEVERDGKQPILFTRHIFNTVNIRETPWYQAYNLVRQPPVSSRCSIQTVETSNQLRKH